MVKKDYAYVLVHFGSNPKYLELELYFIKMLQLNTNYDIVYMYSCHDTPQEFIKIVKLLKVRMFRYDDRNITYDIKNFTSSYISFNTLRTCNFLFASKLTEYKKICMVESDLVLTQNIDSIFNFQEPAILHYYYKNYVKQNENNQITLDKNNLLSYCSEKSNFNGGVLLFSPSEKLYHTFIKNISLIIKNNCKYPNELLFALSFSKIYNLPIRYNFSHYFLGKDYHIKTIYIYHFNESQYKPLSIIKNNYLSKEKDRKRKIILLYFKKTTYDIYHKYIDKLMKKYLKNI